jgi:hypothetical protein
VELFSSGLLFPILSWIGFHDNLLVAVENAIKNPGLSGDEYYELVKNRLAVVPGCGMLQMPRPDSFCSGSERRSG